MVDSGTSLLDENINNNTEYLNWPGLKKLVNNINILPEDEWHLNKEYFKRHLSQTSEFILNFIFFKFI